VKLARADQRSGLIRGDLEGRGILAEDSENRPRHRLVYVSFSPPNSHRPVFSALVDLTALRVLELRPVAETKPALKGR
jgi:hypothetical protein